MEASPTVPARSGAFLNRARRRLVTARPTRSRSGPFHRKRKQPARRIAEPSAAGLISKVDRSRAGTAPVGSAKSRSEKS
jgi:hypothetical protein